MTVGALATGCGHSANRTSARPVVRPTLEPSAGTPAPSSQANGSGRVGENEDVDEGPSLSAAGATPSHSPPDSKEPPREEVLVGTGDSPDGTTWQLFATVRESGETCERFRFVTRLGGGGGSSCGRPLPLGHSQTLWSGRQAVDGPVTQNAVRVVVSSRSGSTTVVQPFGGEFGFGRAFYVAFPPAGPLEKIVAYDAADRVVGEIRFNAQEQDALVRQQE